MRTKGIFVLLAVAYGALRPGVARAEFSVANANGWELYTDGRINGFLSYTRGDGYPVTTATQTPYGGGVDANTANPIADPMHPEVQPTLEGMRIRSGFLGNVLGFGIRTGLSDTTKLSAYFALWSDIESESRRKYLPMPVDVREAYLKADGPWGTFKVGRQLTLFSRGAVEIDFLYGHGYGLGFPGSIDSNGPAAGHIGYGVIGPGFGAGMVYATPSVAGLQLTFGLFDPVQLQGAWPRTKYVRPEAELTFDQPLGSFGKIHLFANGVYQKVYLTGDLDSKNATVYGAGYGGRIELGMFRLGLAGHYGQGLGLYYALETSEAAYNEKATLRKSDGYYAQAQLAFTKFDVNAGVGISRVYELPTDNVPNADGISKSLIKYQLGASLAFVYHISEHLHFDIDGFRASYRWYLGQKQDVYFVNSGFTMTW